MNAATSLPGICHAAIRTNPRPFAHPFYRFVSSFPMEWTGRIMTYSGASAVSARTQIEVSRDHQLLMAGAHLPGPLMQRGEFFFPI